MTRLLTPEQVGGYGRDGFVFPIDVLSADEMRQFRGELEAWERQRNGPIDFPEKSKSYLLFNWADQLVHHPKVLNAVEDVIGSHILVYHSTLFLKEARTPAYVRWHQDSPYFYLEPREHVTAWVALSDASVEAGCMRALLGSHRWGIFEHDDKPEPLNMIKRGQGISERFDHETGTFMPVKSGQMSLHHTDLVHASGCACAAATTAISYPRSGCANRCRTRRAACTRRLWRCSARARTPASPRPRPHDGP
jgi:non-haem Fe2+, alpha-ketoglutarate-dependent halogenase